MVIFEFLWVRQVIFEFLWVILMKWLFLGTSGGLGIFEIRKETENKSQ